jgi:hypothetical protein
MITTVTTSTVSSITTVSLSLGLAALAVATFAIFLVQKDVLSNSTSEVAVQLRRAINVAIVPLALAFLMAVAAKLVEVFSA